MIGNKDIFDEEELKAIAADESSAEGSSCQHSSLDSDDAPTNENDFSIKEKTSNTAATNMKEQGKERDGSSSDDSSDDGGFLESWLEAEKKKSDSNIHQDIQISQNETRI